MAARNPPRALAAVVLAAGEGKRMRSDRPKVLHEVCGRPSLWHVAKSALAARPTTLAIVVGQRKERVEEAVRSWRLKPEPAFVHQGKPLGTGHAVAASEDSIGDAEDVLVLAGDDPLVTEEHVRSLLKVHRRTRAAGTILTTMLENPAGFGRVIREGEQLMAIVQDSDASRRERAIKEVSTLVYVFRREDLFRALPLVNRENRQREYYLPDVIRILLDKSETVSAMPADFGGALGLNSRGGLATVSRIMRTRIIERHMESGVTFLDPATTYVDVDVRIGPDTVIHPMTFLEGDTRIGAGCSIGPATRVTDSTVGDDSEVTFSVVRESRIGGRSTIGPYAHLRPGTVLEEEAKAGSFVEIKASRVGKGSKVPHLSYVGDATIGEGANIGAGTVTVNYDGYKKHPTVIGDGAFIGSDTMLIAPVRVGKEASTGAGSVITRDVPAGALAVERAEQRIVAGYAERKRAARGSGKGRSKRDKTRGRKGGG
jgi:bifunctional UDP-N-acetylglucosamine pyrophosphorylase/glucosamine-1-phosphate N-acetyltransferase